jgi:hypothetical protein
VYAARALATPTTVRSSNQPRWSYHFNHVRDVFRNRLGRLALEDRPVAGNHGARPLVLAMLIAAVLIVLPLVRFARAGVRAPHCGRFLLYFAGLGMGFIMIEMALLQRFTLFLGQPVYTFAVVLAGLLVCTGVGASLAGRLRSQPRQHLRWILFLILATVVSTALLVLVCSAALACRSSGASGGAPPARTAPSCSGCLP